MTETPDINKTLLDMAKAAKKFFDDDCFTLEDLKRIREQLDAAIEAAEPRPAKRDRGMEMAREMVQVGQYFTDHAKLFDIRNMVWASWFRNSDRGAVAAARDAIAAAINARAEEVKAGAVNVMETKFFDSPVRASAIEAIKAL